MDRVKLQQAIDHLQFLYSVVDNRLYDSYSPESLKKELDEIEASKAYLESLLNEATRCAWCNKSEELSQSMGIGTVQGKDLPFCDDKCHQHYLDAHRLNPRDCPTREDLENWERGLGDRHR